MVVAVVVAAVAAVAAVAVVVVEVVVAAAVAAVVAAGSRRNVRRSSRRLFLFLPRAASGLRAFGVFMFLKADFRISGQGSRAVGNVS